MSGRKRRPSGPVTTKHPPEGPQEQKHRQAPDRLDVMTALLMTPEEFPGELAETFPEACAALGIAPAARGYGLILAQDQDGGRWTQITTDASGVMSAQSIWNMGLVCGYEPPEGSVVAIQPGWPVDCPHGLAGLHEPHDPADADDKEILRPPRRGTPARRRGMADIIAGELTDMRGRTLEEYTEAHRWDAYNMGDTDPSPPPARIIDLRGRIDPGHPAHHAIDRAVAAAWSLAAAAKPPPGSVRTTKASPGNARMIRASADGWTVIGRTDGPVLLLTDDLPGLPVDISDTPAMPKLLDALTAASDHAPH